MSKFSMCLLICAVSGCATELSYIAPSELETISTLEFKLPENPQDYPFANGISSVDGAIYPEHTYRVYVGPGVREVGVNCLRDVNVGKQQLVQVKFRESSHYEIRCEHGEAVVRESELP